MLLQGEEAGDGVQKADVVQALESTLEQLQVPYLARRCPYCWWHIMNEHVLTQLPSIVVQLNCRELLHVLSRSALLACESESRAQAERASSCAFRACPGKD